VLCTFHVQAPRVRVRAWSSGCISLDVFSAYFVKITTGDHNFHGLRAYIAHAMCAVACVNHACIYIFSHLWTDYLKIWWEHTADHQKLRGLLHLCMNALLTAHAHIPSRIVRI
jgi:hypothetical protein